jgi:hypothetical protein
MLFETHAPTVLVKSVALNATTYDLAWNDLLLSNETNLSRHSRKISMILKYLW